MKSTSQAQPVDELYSPNLHKRRRFPVPAEQDEEDIEHAGTIFFWNYYKTIGRRAEPKSSYAPFVIAVLLVEVRRLSMKFDFIPR